MASPLVIELRGRVMVITSMTRLQGSGVVCLGHSGTVLALGVDPQGKRVALVALDGQGIPVEVMADITPQGLIMPGKYPGGDHLWS